MYMCGGHAKGDIGPPIRCLDLKTLRWRKIECNISDQPSPRYGSMYSYERKLYFIGGSLNSQVSSDLTCFDPETTTWTFSSDPAISGRDGHQAIVMNGAIIIYGGLQSNLLKPRDDLSLYDPKKRSWSCHRNLGRPTPRSFHTFCLWKDKIYVWGGYDLVDMDVDATVDVCQNLSDMYVMSDSRDAIRPLSFGAINNSENPFRIFPREIVLEILTYLSAEDLGRVGRVDQFFRYHRSQEDLWRNHLRDLLPYTIKSWDVKYDTFKLKTNQFGFYFNGYRIEIQKNNRFVSNDKKIRIAKILDSLDLPEIPKIKMVILGESGVGKSAVMYRYLDEVEGVEKSSKFHRFNFRVCEKTIGHV
eukprot:TRINITY_DN2778_c1_g1_i3.p1 TRINITY_DN2778_c1_g1~~TRINITY_DN2778_c1_g1_i3.p1  ORF type:complete len:359 (+),score=65.90 TRINITY_DN2778_c1_g1_i3:422-1498(+)